MGHGPSVMVRGPVDPQRLQDFGSWCQSLVAAGVCNVDL